MNYTNPVESSEGHSHTEQHEESNFPGASWHMSGDGSSLTVDHITEQLKYRIRSFHDRTRIV
ncbi:hypothetical protein [Paenibacillus sediminis]|uniref:Uncharacterized protein n=1 Tax=Paenibacillus sediminis TaxID=664909 RepID=A0ABS4H6C0_9BACL|nr:hypothetical protein [Paenibacillus sediminis]MBP1938084.1 hypothetical protein [Paenibacillus sediminis]